MNYPYEDCRDIMREHEQDAADLRRSCDREDWEDQIRDAIRETADGLRLDRARSELDVNGRRKRWPTICAMIDSMWDVEAECAAEELADAREYSKSPTRYYGMRESDF